MDAKLQTFIHSLSIDAPAQEETFDGWSWAWLTSLFSSLYTFKTNNIVNLDQLYVQARGMDPVMRVKARSWAIASGGTFRHAKLKSVERAVEKLDRCYMEEVSRLLDVCRQSIVFSSVKDLHVCLYHMVCDPQVEIVHIKNRLDRHYNSFQSAGYRDVKVNMRIHNRDTERLGLNAHVVEVLLELQCFVDAVTPESHKRYTEFRSVREVMEPSSLRAALLRPFEDFASFFSLPGVGNRNRIMPTSTSDRGGGSQPSASRRGSIQSNQSQQSMGSPVGAVHRVRPFRQPITSQAGAQASVSSDPSLKQPSQDGVPAFKVASFILARAASGNDKRHPEAAVFLPSGYDDGIDMNSPLRHHGRDSLDQKSLLPEAFNRVDSAEQEQAGREAVLFQAWFRIVSSFPGKYMGNKLKSVSDAIGDTGSAQALFTARPVAAALRFVLFRAIISVMFFIMTFRSVSAFTSPLFTANHLFFGSVPSITPEPADVGFYTFRFTALGLRSGQSNNITSPHIERFNVLQGGCAVLPEPMRVMIQGASMVALYNTSIKLDGVRITTSALGDPQDDPVQWLLEAEVSQVGPSPAAEPVWEAVASSNMKWTRKIQNLHLSMDTSSRYTIDTFRMPRGRLAVVDVSTKLTWSAVLVYAISPLFAAIGLLSVLYSSVQGRTGRCARILSGMCLLCWFTVSVAGILLFSNPLHTTAVDGGYWILYGLLLLVYSVQMYFYESYFVQWLPVSGAYICLVELVWNFGLRSAESCRIFEGCNAPMVAVGLMLSSNFIFFWKYWSLATSKAMIAQDMANYTERWRVLYESSKDEVEALCSMVSELDMHEGMARQYARKKHSPLKVASPLPRVQSEYAAASGDNDNSNSQLPLSASSSHDAPSVYGRPSMDGGAVDRSSRSLDVEERSQASEVGCTPERSSTACSGTGTGSTNQAPNKARKKIKRSHWSDRFGSGSTRHLTSIKSVDTNTRISSLDQLCAQATGLDPILRSKVQDWALVSKGHFRYFDNASAKSGFVLWETAAASEELKARIKWGKLKKLTRAVEKLMRVYREDVSKLLDVCRQSIVFDRISDLTVCLRAIMNDPEVEIVRIKNRLDPNYNAIQSAGYRDVALNMRISNEDTARLGIDVHVCEVQLLVRTFAEVKNESGHKRYTEFRNRRGE